MEQPEITPDTCAAIYGGSAPQSDRPESDTDVSANPEPKPEPKPEPEPIEKLLEEAERKGYLRGRNEALAGIYNSPAVWEEPDNNIPDPSLRPSPADSFLTGRRKGVWE
ncbi:MAG: hypothetical protein K2M05_02495 [Paramuribaculum sp.]|nr:hypothetical protein [Paramuribaculum sp.]MDE6303993.1 hypothetical protein [Paramuribaculum sp.]